MPNRREFLRQAAAGVVGVSLGPTVRLLDAQPARADDLIDGFESPPPEARPFFRWWWNGNRVTAEEIRRELRVMKDAGAGGVEINPIALHDAVENPTGQPLDWLSPEWNEMVRVAVDEAERLDMTVDMIVGTGWPFGGEFLRPEDLIRGLELEVTPMQGPSTQRHRVRGLDAEGSQLVHVLLVPENVGALADAQDLTDRFGADGVADVQVPDGSYRLLVLTRRVRFREVMHGAPGGQGPVLDHFNRAAVERYLGRMSGRLSPALGGSLGNGIRAMFTDSIELSGANWTRDLGEIFAERRGYALDPYLPLVMATDLELADPLREEVERVRYDFSRTISEVFMERFIRPFHRWCNRNGTLSRYQAYGYPWLITHMTDGYMVPDIPEGDQWLFNDGWVHPTARIDGIRYAIWNKYASSGGHLAGRRVVSSEAMTNVRGVFQASLEYIKQATDANFIAGVNHLVLHGFNYSPPEAGFPGWVRYGTYFSEQNPWWPHARKWMDYTARLSWVFQAAKPVTQIAILGPTPDVWSQHGLDRNPFNRTPWYLHALWQAFSHHGYAADYVSASVLEEATVKDGTLRYGPATYEALVLTDVRSLRPETAEAIARYARGGGRIVFVGEQPSRAPGLLDRGAGDRRVQAAMDAIVGEHSDCVWTVDAPTEENRIAWAGTVLRDAGIQPLVRISDPDPRLFTLRARADERDVVFFSNLDRDRELQFTAHVQNASGTPWRWDAESGKRAVYRSADDPGPMPIKLAPLESLLLVFEPDETPPATPLTDSAPLEVSSEVQGPWHVHFEHVDGTASERVVPELFNLAEDPELSSFAGFIRYRTTFEIDRTAGWWLDLGDVAETAEVTLNGEALGVAWWGRRRVALGDAVVAGRNELEVRISTLLFNYVRSLEDHPVARFWVEQSNDDSLKPAGLLGPVRLMREV